VKLNNLIAILVMYISGVIAGCSLNYFARGRRVDAVIYFVISIVYAAISVGVIDSMAVAKKGSKSHTASAKQPQRCESCGNPMVKDWGCVTPHCKERW